ncbi:MAG: oligosaccharide flippase family protein [Paracoccaceae bacterium]
MTTESRLRRFATSGTLTARILRGAALLVGSFGLSQVLRLLSNLVLTRLLFPEAFGLMGLVTVFLIGMVMFSDVGIGQAIARSPRGDDKDFLDTAWTLQILRGALLFLVGLALANPVAAFYGEPVLAGMLALASVQLLAMGFMPTKRDTANRHLRLGRLTLLDLAVQVLSLVIMVALAFWLRSVWALVLGSIAGTVLQILFTVFFLPGPGNRLRLERAALQELVHFGKWIFLSTICGFLLSQGDKLILGKFLPLDAFGIYNIGFFLGSFPAMLGTLAISRLLIPIYRERPPGESRDNFLKLRKMRILVSGGLMAVTAVAAFLGPWFVSFLYDGRYHDAGVVVTLVACIQIATIIGLTYDNVALAAGDSRRFFVLMAIRTILLIAGLYFGVQMAGLPGALIGQGLAMLASYPALVWLVRRLGAWDPLHDGGFAALGVLIAVPAIWWRWDVLVALGN